MFTHDGSFIADGTAYSEWRTTSDGLVAVQTGQWRWTYYRLNWRTTCYDYVGWTSEFHDPNREAFDRSETFVVRR